MEKVTQSQVLNLLQEVGVRPGDGLLVHSALQYLGQPEGGVEIYFQVLSHALGTTADRLGFENLQADHTAATLVVPTFTLTFAHGETFDIRSTPSQGMGVFSEWVRCLPVARRTPHPLQSVAALGRFATDLASRDTLSAFDPDSAFERMLELDFKLLLLGASIQAASIVHYSEQRLSVPYRYWKDFTGMVRVYPPEGEAGESSWETRTYRMYARNLELDPRLDLTPVQSLLEQRGQWSSQKLNYGRISACRLVDFVSAADELLEKDPWILVANRSVK